MNSAFKEISEAARDLIRKSPGVPPDAAVIAYEHGSAESEMLRDAGRIGLAAIVLPFEPRHSIFGTNPPFYDQADLTVHVVENPDMNLTGCTGAALRDAVALALCGEDLGGLVAEPLTEHDIARADEGPLTVWEMTWKTAAQLRE